MANSDRGAETQKHPPQKMRALERVEERDLHPRTRATPATAATSLSPRKSISGPAAYKQAEYLDELLLNTDKLKMSKISFRISEDSSEFPRLQSMSVIMAVTMVVIL